MSERNYYEERRQVAAMIEAAKKGAGLNHPSTKRKKRPPQPKAATPVSYVWAPQPLVTCYERPGSGRPVSAIKPPKSITMTLHYARARYDGPLAVKDVATPRSRPATAGNAQSRDWLATGSTQFGDTTTGESMGGAARQRPNTARGDLGRTNWHHPRDSVSSSRPTSARNDTTISKESRDAVEEYNSMLAEAESEINQMVVAERPMTARGTKTEEFEYVETLLRNPQKIHLRKKIEQIEEEIDPRKEALVAYRDACVKMRMPCPQHLSVKHYEYHKTFHEQREALNKEPHQEEGSPRVQVTEAQIQAMSRAIWKTLRKKKKKNLPQKETTWRDKYDNNGKSKEDPWWMASDDPCSPGSAWLKKYLEPTNPPSKKTMSGIEKSRSDVCPDPSEQSKLISSANAVKRSLFSQKVLRAANDSSQGEGRELYLE